ncbi:MAG TPA: hypothetical protein VFS90_01995 [Pyrinomonadaceae bacterium]|nr:hypothetical protein [Pyrinomonadaceae bacterium]
MTHIKCSQCGLNNWHGAQVCERCGSALEQTQPEPVATPPPPPRPDFPVLYGGEAPAYSRTWKIILAVVITLAVGGGAWAVYKSRAKETAGKRRPLVAERTVDERTRDAVLACLAYPGFVGTKVSEQVIGPVRLELLQVPDKEVYFSAPEKLSEALESIVARFVIDPKRIVTAEDDNGRLRIGKYSLLRSPDKYFFFKTPVDNIKFDNATVLKFPFKQATYTLDMRELDDFLANKSIFGGRMNARTEQTRGGLPVVFANHGAFVAKSQETSLRRFVDELTRDIQPNSEGAREARVQRVLDFVSREIKYDLRETTYNFELLKRPNEVLMSGESDCSNKAILLGSMLEQLGEDYLFVYTPDHITVAVKQGNFPAGNGLFLAWQGEVWLIAEGTAPGFRIGIDRVQEEARLKQFQHVQRPRERDIIFDLATGRQLSFQ